MKRRRGDCRKWSERKASRYGGLVSLLSPGKRTLWISCEGAVPAQCAVNQDMYQSISLCHSDWIGFKVLCRFHCGTTVMEVPLCSKHRQIFTHQADDVVELY